MSLGGQKITEDDIRQYLAMQTATPPAGPAMTPYMDPTAIAQQAILARPMRPSFTGQPLMSREVPLGIQGNAGLAYPSMGGSGLLNVPSYTSRYASGGGGSGGSDASQAPSSWSSMTPAEQAAYYAANPNMAAVTRAGQAAFGYTLPGLVQGLMVPGFVQDQGLIAMGVDPAAYQNAKEGFRASEINAMNAGYPSTIDVPSYTTSYESGVGNPGESYGGYTSSDTGVGNPGESYGGGYTSSDTGVGNPGESYGGPTSAESGVGNPGESAGDSGGGGGGKIVCTAMNQQYGFGSFRNAIWLKYAENNLTKAHEAGYHAIFLPLVDFAFKQGDGKLNMLTRKFLENCARHRSLDLRAEMRGTKRDTIGMIYRSVLEPLCYAVGKIKGY